MVEFTVENGKVGWKGSENNRARGKLSFSSPSPRARVQFPRENRGQINALLRIEEHHSRVERKGFVSAFVTRGFYPKRSTQRASTKIVVNTRPIVILKKRFRA